MDDTILDRIHQLIEASGKSQRAIADLMGIDAPKLSKSLKGVRRFTSYELASLAELGGRTVEWILTGSERQQLSFVHRSTATAPTSVDNPGREYAMVIAERYQDARELGFAPESPTLPRVTAAGGRYLAQAESLAEDAVELLGVSLKAVGLSALIRAVEDAFGAQVAVDELAEGIDGLSLNDDDLRLMVLAPTDRTGRQRFTLAHELGHILFRDGDQEPIEEQLFQDKSQPEKRADAFAAAFLMPPDEIAGALGDREAVDAFPDLTWSFRVSPDSMAWRLQNLGHITEEQRTQLMGKTLSRVAASLGKMDEHRLRIDEAMARRAAGRLSDAFIGAYLAGLIGAGPVSDISGHSVDVVQRLLDDADYPDSWPNTTGAE